MKIRRNFERVELHLFHLIHQQHLVQTQEPFEASAGFIRFIHFFIYCSYRRFTQREKKIRKDKICRGKKTTRTE